MTEIMKSTRDVIGLDDIEGILLDNCMLDDLFFYQDVKDRKLCLTSTVCSDSVNTIIRNILKYNKEDKDIPVEERKPIIIYLDTYGGDVASGFGLIDAITASKTPVYTMNLACCYSMGFLIYLAGHKRFSFANSRFLLHDGTEYIYDSSSKAYDYAKFSSEVEKRIKEFVLNKTGISSKKYENNRRCEWYMLAATAKGLGVVDEIIGEDCDIDAII